MPFVQSYYTVFLEFLLHEMSHSNHFALGDQIFDLSIHWSIVKMTIVLVYYETNASRMYSEEYNYINDNEKLLIIFCKLV